MTWICHCGLTNVNANTYCAACIFTNPQNSRKPSVENETPDSYDELLQHVRSHTERDRLGFSTEDIYLFSRKDNPMTPQEELFSQLFNHEKILVKDMEMLELRAHREQLVKIAFEAKVRLSAVDDTEKERRNKSNVGKPTGFSRSVNIDESTTNAINNIKERKQRMTKTEKITAGLIELFEKSGMSKEDATKEATTRMSAGEIIKQVRVKEQLDKDAIEKENEVKVFNPFAKKE